TIRTDAAVQGHAVHDGAHGMLADAVVHDAAAGAAGEQAVRTIDVRLVGAAEVRGASYQVRDAARESLDDLSGPSAGRIRLLHRGQFRVVRVPTFRQLAGHHPEELVGFARMMVSVRIEARLPILLELRAPRHAPVPLVTGLGR